MGQLDLIDSTVTSTVQYCSVLYDTVLYCTPLVQYSLESRVVQYSTVRYTLYCTVRYNCRRYKNGTSDLLNILDKCCLSYLLYLLNLFHLSHQLEMIDLCDLLHIVTN